MERGYDYKKHAVLFVDDEEKALKYFDRSFGNDFRVLTASSAADGWAIVEREANQLGVLISDQRMPGETGVHLLERVKTHHPQIVRILTTAYSDLESAIDAVNAGGAFRYIAKPWDVKDVRGILLRALEFYAVRQERDALLSEKLSVLQRLMMMDRVRGLSALAASLNWRLRNSLGALKAYIRQASFESPKLSQENAGSLDMMWLARTEGEFLVDAVAEVLQETTEQERRFDKGVNLCQIVERVVNRLREEQEGEGVSFDIQADPDIPPLRADTRMLERMVTILTHRITNMDGEDHRVCLRVQPGDSEQTVKLQITVDGGQWRNGQVASLYSAAIPKGTWFLGMDMDALAAFFIAFHHGGNLQIQRTGSDGPGFLVTLRCDPESTPEESLGAAWFDDVFAALEDLSQP